MSDQIEPLIRDLLEWIGPTGRPYAETLDAWRTSCPRLPVWEEATDRGLIRRCRTAERGATVQLSPAGAALIEHRPPAPRLTDEVE